MLVTFAILSLMNMVTNGVQTATKVGEDPSWNYDNHGTDWDFLNCNNTAVTQSPIDLELATIIFQWTSKYAVSFLTGWKTASIKAEDHGVSNYTYRINATDGNMGIFYASEVFFASPAQIEWEV